jgi:tripartite-type tricarboxylate transporter receptor subunit TctC
MFPEKAITLISTFPTGGPVDVAARALAEAGGKYFPHPLLIEERPGKAGTVGATAIMKAAPDGYTLGVSAMGALTIQPHLQKVPFGSPDSFTAVINLINNPVCLAVRADAPWKNFQEFISYTKINPGKLRVGNLDPGSALHLNAEQLRVQAGIEIQHVHFTSGPQSLEALLSGKIDALSQHNGLVFPAVRSGKARVLAVFEEKRNHNFPEAPASKELGYEITLGGYLFVVGPRGLPSDVVAFLHQRFKKTMEDPSFVGAMESRGYEIFYEGPEDLKKRLQRDFRNNARLLERTKVKIELSPSGYPQEPITVIVGFPPGGSLDLTAQPLVKAVNKFFPQPMKVVHQPGAAGTKAMGEFLKALPDGYTLNLAAMGLLTLQPHLHKLPYNTPEDYTPIMNLVNNPMCLAVKHSAPWKTLQEFIAEAKTHPGKIRVGDLGQGSSMHLATEQLKAAAKIDLTPVHFTGAPETVNALLEGKVDALTQHHAVFPKEVEGGRVRILGVYERARNALFPDAPTFREIGYDVVFDSYACMIGPPGLPAPILAILHESLKKAMSDPDFIDAMKAQGLALFYQGPEELKKTLWRDYEQNARLVEQIGFSAG